MKLSATQKTILSRLNNGEVLDSLSIHPTDAAFFANGDVVKRPTFNFLVKNELIEHTSGSYRYRVISEAGREALSEAERDATRDS